MKIQLNRLFWKFFAAFWSANIFIMLVTSYVLLNHMETQRLREHYQKLLTELVDEVESNPQRFTAGKLHHRLPRRFGRTALARTPVIEIYIDEQKHFEYRSRGTSQSADATFTVESAAGAIYQVQTVTPKPPRFIAEWVQRKHKLEFLVILLVSTVVSLLLSWSVTRPLKQLGFRSRQLARGDWQTRINHKLTLRGDELGSLARDMTYMMETVNATLAAQKQLLHDVSHELRAPLARLQVAAELLQQKALEDNPQVQRIHRECQRIDQLIQRILHFSRMEESAELSDLDLVSLVKEQVDNARFENPQREIRFAPDMPQMHYRGYPSLLRQSVENIVRNACKYTPDTSAIEISLSCAGDQNVLIVRDYGPGVNADDLPKLVEPFFRGGNSMHGKHDNKGSGFGLGLSIAQRAMQKHGGRLQLENHPFGGLQVTLSLPL